MPRGDGTGPRGDSSPRGGRMGGNRAGAGAVGNCVCPGCGTKVPHQRGVPCYDMKCPKCGKGMARE